MAVALSTTNEFLLRDGSYLDTTAAFTITGWANQGATTPTGFRTYYNYGDGAGSDAYLYLGSDTNANNLRLAYWDGVDYVQTATAFSPVVGMYFYWAMRYDGASAFDFIINGLVLETLTVDLSAITFPTTDDSVGGSWVDFSFALIGVFQSHLTLTQITAQSQSQIPLSTALAFTPLAFAADLDDVTANGEDWGLSGTLTAATGPSLAAIGDYPYTTNPLFSAPPAASGVTVTPNAGSWANSAWVTLVATTDAAWILTGLVVRPDNTNANEQFEIDVGVGAAASEVVVTTFRGTFLTTTTASPGILPAPIPLDNIGVGVRVAVRMRKQNASTNTWTVGAQYYKKPLVGNLLTSAKPQKSYPSSATDVLLTAGATAWASSTYTELVESTATAIVLVGMVIDILSLNSGWEVDLAIGTAGNEVVIQTVRAYHTGIQATDGPNFVPFRRPCDSIPAASRIAARTRSQIAIGTRQMYVALVYLEKPL